MPPSFTLQVGTQAAIDLAALSASVKDLMPNINDLNFVVNGGFEQLLNTPLSQINAPHNTAALSYGSSQQSWNPYAGPVTFTLSGNVGASVTVINSGSIFGQDNNGNDIVYYDGFDNPQPIKTFTVPAGWAFIATQLNLGISGSVSVSSTFGTLGVTAQAAGSVGYSVTHFKAFPVNTTLGVALPQALAEFVLPLHAQTAAKMQDKDVLAYAFDGTLEVGFGLNYGIKGSIAGYSASPALTVGSLSKLIAVPASVKPSYTIGASFAIKFPWSRVFQCIVQRTNNSGVNTATVHIFQQTKSEINAEIDAGVLTGSLNASASATVNTTSLAQSITEKLFGTGTPPPGFSSVLNAATGEMNKYVSDVNGFAKKLLTAIPSGQSGIAVIIDSLNTTTSCFQYVFDLNDATNFPDAWNTAMKGDFVGAFNYPTAVSLAPGSGFEKYFQEQTSLKLEIFGYTLGTAISIFYNDVSITYAGGGRFLISSKTGRSYSSSSLSSSSSTDLYFSATADSTAALQASGLAVSFNAVLTANKNSKAVSGYTRLLQSLNNADAATAATNLTQGYVDGDAGPIAIHFSFSTTAYQKITSTAYVGSKPVAQQYQSLDEANWDAYTKASDVLRSLDPPANQLSQQPGAVYKNYSSWAYYNRVLMNGGTPPPDRRELFVPGEITEEVCDTIMGGSTLSMYGNSLRLYYLGGQEFMNLCDDLRPIVADQSAASIGWRTVQKDLAAAANDLDPWFGAVTVLALANLCAHSFEVNGTWGTESAAINIDIS